jgi:hypothetical protein
MYAGGEAPGTAAEAAPAFSRWTFLAFFLLIVSRAVLESGVDGECVADAESRECRARRIGC